MAKEEGACPRDTTMSRLEFLKPITALLAVLTSIAAVRSLLRIGKNLSEKNVSLVAGGVAFYAFLSIFPSIFALIFLWELFASDANAFVLLDFLSYVMPEQAFEVVGELLIQITEREQPASLIATLISLLVALWSSSRATDALLMAIHMMYRNPFRRGVVKQRAIALGFTVSGIVFVIISVVIIGAVPPVLNALNLGAFAEIAVLSLRWVFILTLFAIGAYTFYLAARTPPENAEIKRQSKLIPGTFAAAVIWLFISLAFSYALSSFVSYNESFGSLGAIAALMMWLWLSAIALLIGAEINTDYAGKQTRALKRQEAAQSLIPPSD